MIFQQLKDLSSLGIVRIIILIISIILGFASAILIILFVSDFCIEKYDASGILYTTGGFFGFAFVALVVEITLIIYCLILFLVSAIVKKINKSNKSPETSKDDVQEEKLFSKNSFGAIAILLGIFILFNGLIVYFVSTDVCIYTQTEIISRSVINPVGTKYTYDDIAEYSVDDDGCNNPVLVLKTKDGKVFEAGSSESAGGTFDDYEYDIDALVRIDEILLEKNVPKTVKCVPYDFDYYEQDKIQLDILMSNETKK